MQPPLRFIRTPPYPCSYLPEETARSLVATPATQVDAQQYNTLIQAGFRRSGSICYRPDCDDCHSCLSARLPVQQMQLDRSQRRSAKRYENHLVAQETALIFKEEHYALYRRYQNARHRDGGMDQDNAEQYERFLLDSPIESHLIEFRENGVLRMVSLMDRVADGLSSVYCFFDPDLPGASFGTYNVIWQAHCCRKLGLPYLYLGYWIENCQKMVYKSRFKPIEILHDGRWQPLDAARTNHSIRENP